LFVLVFGYVC